MAKLNSNILVISGCKTDDMMYWCVVNLTDGRVDSTYNICKGGLSWSRSHLAIKNNKVYISCWTYDSTNNGVYAYDIFNPRTHKFLYQHRKWTPGSIMVDRRNFIYVCDLNSNSIHQLTRSGHLVTIHTVSSRLHGIFYDDQHGVLYTTRQDSNVITVYKMEYLHQPGIPEEIINMDDRSIQLFEEALKDGQETVYSVRIMVVGHVGVGKTTLVKRLLGEEVNITERCSTEGIDFYVNCCDVSLSTREWTRRTKDSEQDYRLQRLARVLIEQHSVKDKVTHEEQVIIPPQGETTQKNHEGDHIDVEFKESEVLYSRSAQEVICQDLSSTASQQEESTPALTQGELIQSEENTTAMLKLLQQNAYKFKQDTDKIASMSVWDFAGQFAFYTTHQTFLTRRAIYLLVSDVSKQLTDHVSDDCYFDSDGIMKCKVHELIEVWLNSIHWCTPFPESGMPPVILVGTHVDKISQRQSPAKGTEPETQTKMMETIEFTPPFISTKATTTTKEEHNAPTFLGALKKVFKPQKTKGIVGATPVSSITDAIVLPAVEQPKTKRKWRFRQWTKNENVDAETEKRYADGKLPNNSQEFIVYTDDYSSPGGVDADNNQQHLIALYNFSSIYSNQLSFSKGDKLRLIGKSDPRWWLAGNSLGEVGLVPSECMNVQICLADNLPNIPQEVIVDTGDYSTPAAVDVDKSQGYNYKMCEKYFREIRSYLRDKPTRFHLVNEDFAINNTVVDPRVEALKKKIVEVASQQPYWGEEIPACWIPLEQELMKLKSAGIKVIPWSLLEDINKSLAVQMTTDELDLFLRFQHDIGTILYFSMEILKEKIVLDPKWMIDALKSLITAEMFVLRNMPGVTDKWFEFKEKGKISLELVDAVWTKQKHPDLHDNKEHILLLMEQLNIIAKLRIYNEEASEIKEENCFLAPCMLRQKTPREVLFPEPHIQMGSSSVLCYVFVGKYLPSPIFHRLLAACVAHWPIATKKKEDTLENLIFCGCCVFQLDHFHKLIINFRDYTIYMRVTRKGIRDKIPSTKLCIEVREFVTAMLTKIIGCLGQSLKFDHFIQCPEYTGDSVNSLIPVSLLKENAEVCCELHNNIIESKNLLNFWFIGMKEMELHGQIHSCTPVMTPIGDCQVTVQTRALPPGKKYHIFFSYCSSDIQWVKETVERLEKVYGFVCREYDRDNTPGTPLLKFADDSIRDAYKTVVVMTREAFQSDFVLFAIDMAILQGFVEKRKCVVPVLLKDCEVPCQLRILNYVDARDPNMRDTWWPKLLMELETQDYGDLEI